MIRALIGLLFLSMIYGCLPKDGGYYPEEGNQGAIAPDQRFPEDYSALQDYFSQFESKTPCPSPSTDYTTMIGFFSASANIVTPSTATVADFLENGLTENLMFSPNPQGLGAIPPATEGKTVIFNLQTLVIKDFYYLGPGPAPYVQIDPPPEDEIPIGTIVLVSIQATENGVASSRWQNAYMLKTYSTFNGKPSFWYVWYGNQNPCVPQSPCPLP